ncbi:hypothetical protein TA3x_000007 [Tundrisphaera sp. TA3]|uniref:hypothetical protein n=1 Tax=Tundrisphaera sp. TA3 TaxID=3435775 RepID=UPI003EBA4065
MNLTSGFFPKAALAMAMIAGTISPAFAGHGGGGGGHAGGGHVGGGHPSGGHVGGGYAHHGGYGGGGYAHHGGYYGGYGGLGLIGLGLGGYGYGNGFGYGYGNGFGYGLSPNFGYSSGYATAPAIPAAQPASAPYPTGQTYEPGDGYSYPVYYDPATGRTIYYPAAR